MNSKLCFVLIITCSILSAQNSDLLMRYDSGYYSSLGGTGLASTKYLSSMDVNPAALSRYTSENISLTQSTSYYNYELLRMRDDIGTLENKWNNFIYNFDQLSLVMPYKDFAFGIGVYRKLSPRIENKKIAVTYSDLFSQETNGNVYSVTAGIGYRLSNFVLLGVSFSNYFGKINSMIRGENHNLDADKWVSMENSLSGIKIKCGLIFSNVNWSAGFTLETPFGMKVKTSKQISANKLYKSLLPGYDEINWKQPLVLAAGISYFGLNNLLLEVDYEIRKYKSSFIQINIFEFGGNPVWQDISIFRFGMEYKSDDLKLPLKLGFTIIPQLYYANNSTGVSNTISSYQNTDQNIKYSYTVGTTLDMLKLSIDLAVNYAVFNWNRTLFVQQSIEDAYQEVNTTFSIRVSYSL